MRYRFTVVIPAFNVRPALDLLFRCLEAQTFGKDKFDCIVIDDGSTDGTYELLRNYPHSFTLRVLRTPVNIGRSSARNWAWRQAAGEIVIFLDGDMLPEPAWLDAYDQAFSDPTVDVVSGGRYSVSVEPGSQQRQLAALLHVDAADLFRDDVSKQFRSLARQARLGQYPTALYERLELELRTVCEKRPTSLLCAFSFVTSNVAVRRSWLEQTTGFSPLIVRLQDTELGLQLWELGARFRFSDAARAYHLFYPVARDLNVYYTDTLALFYRHPYKHVLAMICWGLHDAPLDTKPSVTALADAGAAELEIGDYFYETFRQRLPLDCDCTSEMMKTQIIERTGLSEPEAAKYLAKAFDTGVSVERHGNEIYFDRYHTVNWLQSNTSYGQKRIEHSCFYAGPSAWHILESKGKALSLHCRGRYEVGIARDAFSASPDDIVLNVPLPTETPGQMNVKITSCTPPHLLDYADWDKGAIIAFPLRQQTPEEMVIGYEFECDIQEWRTAEQRPRSGESAKSESVSASCRPGLPPSYVAKAKGLLARIFPEKVESQYQQARFIYSWILDNTIYKETTHSNLLIFDTGMGPCSHAATMFVNLCRLIGIQARLRYGAVLLRAVEVNSRQIVAVSNDTGFSAFLHTWAECCVDDCGWIPVEFLSWHLGRRAVTGLNIVDHELKSRVIKNTDRYDEYFFGNIDPFRIRTTDYAGRLTTYPIVKSNGNLEHVRRAFNHTQHRLTCTLCESSSQP